MTEQKNRRRPGHVRDSLVDYLKTRPEGASMAEIYEAMGQEVPRSSIRSSLRLSDLFVQKTRGVYELAARR